MADTSELELLVFSTARRLPLGQRAAYLESACAGDTALRQRVEELLEADAKAATFLERPAAGLPQAGPEAAPAGHAEQAGDWIGRYRLVEPIGEGGCGIVYLAEQAEPVHRRVALKVIKLGMDTRSVIARFEAERQALALMDHPLIAKVLDAGATQAGRPYFVMELVPGAKITDCCDQQCLSTRERLKLVIQICHAIQHAHQKGIIHRDLKPSNILVAMHDGVPCPKVIDFGIAKATHGKLTEQTLFTAFGQFIGTPAYVSPEQAEGGGLDVDTRSDIYSLGVLLYELLTGHTPFEAKELLQVGWDELRRTIREQEPATPSARLSTLHGATLTTIAKCRKTDPPRLLHQVRGDLDWIVMKALEKDRARRYATAQDFAADLQRHLDHEPVVARPPSSFYQFQKLVRRHRLGFVASGTVAAALAFGLAVSVRASWKEHQARLDSERDRLQARANEQKAQVEAAKSRQVAQFLEEMLSGVGPSVAMGNDTTLLRKILGNTAKRIGTDLGQQPEVEAELRFTLGEVYWELGDLENAEAMHRRALALRIQVFGRQHPQVAQSMSRLGHVLWRRGKLEEAEQLARAAVGLQRQLFGNQSLEVARSLQDLAAILNTQNNGAEAERALREALKTKEALLGQKHLEVADAQEDLALFLFSRQYQPTEPEALSRQALATRRELLGQDNPLVRIAELRFKALELGRQNHRTEEEATLKELVRVQRKVLGEQHPNVAQSLNSLAWVLQTQRKLPESEAVRREALAMQCKLLGEDSPEVAKTLMHLGELLMLQHKLADAEDAYRRALKVRQNVFGPDSPLVADTALPLAQVLGMEGKWESVRNMYLEAAAGHGAGAAQARYELGRLYLQGQGGPKDVALGTQWLRKAGDLGHTDALVDLGVLYFEGDGVAPDEAEALKWFNQAAEQHPAPALRALAECYCAAGRTSNALAVLQRACEAQPNDGNGWFTLATWQVWFGMEADYKATRQRLIQLAASKEDAINAQSAAKAYCLRASTDAAGLAQALRLAQRAEQLSRRRATYPWYQLCLGLAEYRNGQFSLAEQTLGTAARIGAGNHSLPWTACFLRAMSLFRLGRSEEAQSLFQETAALIPPPPADSSKPVLDGKTVSHDLMLCWLAYREAQALLGSTEGGNSSR